MIRYQGILLALLAAMLFGVGTPLVKLWFGGVDPILLAALISFGSGVSVAPVAPRACVKFAPLLRRENRWWFASSLLLGGIAAPFFIVWGIEHASGTTAALLLNLEAAFTSLIAWHFAKEHVSRRMVLGIAALTAGGVLLSGHEVGGAEYRPLADLAIAATCLCWAIDNNCTARLKNVQPVQFTFWKGVTSGMVLLAVALARRTPMMEFPLAAKAIALGSCCYGWALLTFVMAIQRMGAGRTSAFFATAPFIGAVLSLVLLHEPVSLPLVAAAVLMGGGVLALLTDPHQHSGGH